MRTVDPDVFVQINDVLCRFFLSFDQRDWPAMAECLAPLITVDYSSSGREPPSTMSGDDFVRRRQNAVDRLSKQHGFSNLLITPQPDGKAVSARCNYLILRFLLPQDCSTQEEGFFHSCGSYQFLISYMQSEWKISSITQHTLRSWGDAALHKSLPR